MYILVVDDNVIDCIDTYILHQLRVFLYTTINTFQVHFSPHLQTALNLQLYTRQINFVPVFNQITRINLTLRPSQSLPIGSTYTNYLCVPRWFGVLRIEQIQTVVKLAVRPQTPACIPHGFGITGIPIVLENIMKIVTPIPIERPVNIDLP